MNTALRKPMTPEQFLAWEERQEPKYEFDGFQPVAIAGGTAAHSRIQRNLAVSISNRLRGSRCEFLGSDMKIEAAGTIRYPDGMVVCSPVLSNATVVRDPVVIFEVLSESTAATDIVSKNQEYAATSSVRRYVILAQDAIGGSMFERVDDDWVGHLLRADTVLRMPEIGIEVPLAELYEGVDVASAGPAAERAGEAEGRHP